MHQPPAASPTPAHAAIMMGTGGPSFLEPSPAPPASWTSAALHFSNQTPCGQHHAHQLPCVSATAPCPASITGMGCPAFLQPPQIQTVSWASAAPRPNHPLCRQHHVHQLPCVSPTTPCAASIMSISCFSFLQTPPVLPT